jgi:predicted ATPase
VPVTLIFDGTIHIIALIIALYFEKRPVVVFEDIDRGIHPSLMSKVIDLLMEVSTDKQIFVTTHNPQVIKHAPHESILLVSRDARGFSTITRPLEKDTIQTFLKHDLSVDDLYIQNMLELS